MKSKADQYLNEIVILSILVLMIVALVAGQADASRAESSIAQDQSGRHGLVIRREPGVANAGTGAIVEVLTLSTGRLDARKRAGAAKPVSGPMR